MTQSEIEVKLEYLGLIEDETTRKRVASFILSEFLSKKSLKTVIKYLAVSEAHSNANSSASKWWRGYALSILNKLTGE